MSLPKYAALGRADPNQLIMRLRDDRYRTWSAYLNRAAEVIEKEFERPDIAAAIVIDAVTAAHKCALSVNSKALEDARNLARKEMCKAASRIRNCLKRIKASIRKDFDQAASIHFREGADLETITAFLLACVTIAKANVANSDAKTILSALGPPVEENPAGPSLKLINDYEALHPNHTNLLEKSLNDLANTSEKLTAALIFDTMAALAEDKDGEGRGNGADVVVAYLKEVASSWRRYGLFPAREQQQPSDHLKHNRQYKSRFHRFAELILIDVLDPVSRTFEPSDDDVERVRQIEKELPRELRKCLIRAGHRDLISDYRIRQALSDSKNDE